MSGHFSFALPAIAALLGPDRDGSDPAVTRLVLVDGLSGAGKSTFVRRLMPHLRSREAGAIVVHADDYIPGWRGLERGIEALSTGVIEPLVSGRPGRARRYDWDRGEPGEWTDILAAPVVVLEGSGVGAAPARDLADVLVWVDATQDERSARLDARDDHHAYQPFREVWAAQEHALLTSRHADRAAHLTVVHHDPNGARADVSCGVNCHLLAAGGAR